MLSLSKFARSGALVAFVLLLAVTPVRASLIGDEVFASMSGALIIDTQFPSPAMLVTAWSLLVVSAAASYLQMSM